MIEHQGLPTIEIDLEALCANYRHLKSRAHGAECAPVVKCDAYGLGAAEVSRALAREGARTFFVTYVAEGAVVRAALKGMAPDAAIYVFNGIGAAAPAECAAAGLVPVLNSLAEARRWAAAGGGAAALHVDTGMNRLGADPSEVDAIAKIEGLAIDLVISHLACASEPDHPMNERQRLAFEAAAARFPNARRSLAASGGTFMSERFHYDVVRPGIALYGASPFDEPVAGLKPVARLTAPILQIRDIAAGATIGYGATFAAPRAMRVATIALGYGDGFLRAAGNRGRAFVGGALRPVLGRVSMDLTVLDVTGLAALRLGERAELFGPSHPIENAARDAGTIAYELLTQLGPRAARLYKGGGAAPADSRGRRG